MKSGLLTAARGQELDHRAGADAARRDRAAVERRVALPVSNVAPL